MPPPRGGGSTVVCPLIEESEALQLQTAVETYRKPLLLPRVAGPARPVLVHGQPAADRGRPP
ncbi:hypothetical protein ACTMU2_33440 [Cupriavidus basilensis]